MKIIKDDKVFSDDCFKIETTGDYFDDSKYTLCIKVRQISKTDENGNVLYGLEQKICETDCLPGYSINEAKNKKFEYKPLVPAVYSNITFDIDGQQMIVEQIIDGKVKKGFIGLTADWNFEVCHYATCGGLPELKSVIELPCEYDDIEPLSYSSIVVKENGKYGLFDACYYSVSNDYNPYSSCHITYRNHFIKRMTPSIYDSIERLSPDFFIASNQDETTLVTKLKRADKSYEPYMTIANGYNSIEPIASNMFVGLLKDEKKEVIFIPILADSYLPTKEGKPFIISPCDEVTVAKECTYYDNKAIIDVTNDGIVTTYSCSYSRYAARSSYDQVIKKLKEAEIGTKLELKDKSTT